MARLALGGFILAIVGGAVWANADTLGLEAAWPVVFGFALAPMTAGRREVRPVVLGTVAGVAIGWAMFATITMSLPFVPVVFGIAAGIAVAVLATLAAVWKKAFSYIGVFGGFGAFVALYEPTWVANRANFGADGASAAAAVLLGLCGGMLLSHATGRLLRVPVAVGVHAIQGVVERRRTTTPSGRRNGVADRRVAVMTDYYGPDRRVGRADRRAGADRRTVQVPAFAMAEGRAS